MAGLGTGAAPFRAFLQHRTLLASQGVPLGPVTKNSQLIYFYTAAELFTFFANFGPTDRGFY